METAYQSGVLPLIAKWGITAVGLMPKLSPDILTEQLGVYAYAALMKMKIIIHGMEMELSVDSQIG